MIRTRNLEKENITVLPERWVFKENSFRRKIKTKFRFIIWLISILIYYNKFKSFRIASIILEVGLPQKKSSKCESNCNSLYDLVKDHERGLKRFQNSKAGSSH